MQPAQAGRSDCKMVDSIPRTITVSLLLHLAVATCCLYFAGTEKAKPVVVDLSLFDLAGGAPGAAGKAAARQGGRGAAAGGFPLTAAAPPPAPQAPQRAPAATAPKAAEATLPAVVRQVPAPAAPVPHPQAQQASVKEPSARPGTGSLQREGAPVGTAAGTQAGTRAQGGVSGRGEGAPGAPGAPGKGGANGNGIGSNANQLRKKYLADHFAYIMRIIQSRLVYPPKARREGLSGKALVSFVVLESGQVSDIKLLHSTEYEILDLNLVKAIKEAAPFPRPPIRAELQMPLSYRLDQ